MKKNNERPNLLTQNDRSQISLALLNIIEADAQKAAYQEQTDEALLALAQQHLPAIRERRIFLSEEILEKEDFEAGIGQQYIIIYKGLIVGQRLLQNVAAIPAEREG